MWNNWTFFYVGKFLYEVKYTVTLRPFIWIPKYLPKRSISLLAHRKELWNSSIVVLFIEAQTSKEMHINKRTAKSIVVHLHCETLLAAAKKEQVTVLQ